MDLVASDSSAHCGTETGTGSAVVPYINDLESGCLKRVLWETPVAICVLSPHNSKKDLGLQNVGWWDAQNVF
jgi:hypothetical protein